MAITARTSFQAAPLQQTLSDNYLDIQTNGWAQQYLPDLMEAEAEVYGKRTISGFLGQVGAEEAMSADQVIWSEQGRLHLSYKGRVSNNNGGTTVGGTAAAQIIIQYDIDEAEGADAGISNGLTIKNHGIRVNDTVIIANATDGVVKALVTRADDLSTIEVVPYGNADPTAVFTDDGTAKSSTILVYGSEYGKGKSYVEADGAGATDSRTANETALKTFNNKTIIMKDYYVVSGSDMAQIGWVEVATEDGTSGYLWYLKAESETRLRFEDYLEMSMMEAEKKAATSQIGAGRKGTEGLFAAIKDRGQVMDGFSSAGGGAGALADFDTILKQLDKEGSIEEIGRAHV